MNFRVLKVARGKSTAAHLTVLTLKCLDDSTDQVLFLSNRMRESLEADLDNYELNALRGQDISLNVEQHSAGEIFLDQEGKESPYKKDGLHFTDFPSVEWTPSAALAAQMRKKPVVTSSPIAQGVKDPIEAAMKEV